MFAILFRALAKPDKRQEFIDFLKRDCKYCDKEEGTLGGSVRAADAGR